MALDMDLQENSHVKVVIQANRTPATEHERRYNAPLCSEVAVLMQGIEHGPRDILLRYRDNHNEKICETHRSYDALQYPLLFPHGDDGYTHSDVPVPRDTKVSAKAFYAFHLMKRPESFNTLLKGRRLFQQYVVDMYAKMETERLKFIRREQGKLRADSYGSLRDALLESI